MPRVSTAAAAGRAGRACLLAACGAALGSCTFDADRPGIGLDLAGRFDHAPQKTSAPLTADWPSLFGSTELTALARATAANNLDVEAAAARILQADAQAQIADSALFPTLTGTSDVQRSISPGISRSSVGTTGSTATAATSGTTTTATTTTTTRSSGSTITNSFDLGLNASYELDLWGKNRLAGLAAEHNAVASRFARDAVVLSSVAGTVNAYFTLLSAQDRLKVADDNLKGARFVLDAIKGRLTVGTVTALEVAQQESVVAQQLAAFPPLQQQLQQAKTQIAILAGRTPESLRVGGGSLNRLRSPRIPAGVPSQLLRRRPDVAEAESTLAGADANVGSAKAALFPSIGLTASGGFESTALRTLLRPESALGSIAAGLTAPILDGGLLQGQLGVQQGVDREDLATYRKAIVQSLVDVENALIAVQQTTEHEKRLADVVEASQRAYTITEERLKEGTIDIVTVLQAELTLFGAQDALAVVRLQRFQALASLAQALGGGWTQPPSAAVPPVGAALPGWMRLLSGPPQAAVAALRR